MQTVSNITNLSSAKLVHIVVKVKAAKYQTYLKVVFQTYLKHGRSNLPYNDIYFKLN